tara:strand:- start:261 stop:515 length:255 start_codon:yes stop_codon:yes gene_type:complete
MESVLRGLLIGVGIGLAILFYKVICSFLSKVILSIMPKSIAIGILFGGAVFGLVLTFTTDLFLIPLSALMFLVGSFILNPNMFD